jgi:hypothetical protein
MATDTALREEIALALPNPFFVGDSVDLVFALKRNFKTPEADSLWLLSVLARLADLSDHRGIHESCLLGLESTAKLAIRGHKKHRSVSRFGALNGPSPLRAL